MKYKSLTQKAITVRFPISDFQKIEEMAENNNSNLAEVLREAWRTHKKENDHLKDFKQLESRLLKQVFNICCAVHGLSNKEKLDALTELKSTSRGNSND
ncbi:MAG: Lon protease-like protein [Colwellia sp.]|jgi:Lon protease-like protein